MKKLTILAISLITSTQIFSQEKFTTYENTFEEKSYEIKISDDEKFIIYIDAMSLDKLHDKGGIFIEQKRHEQFINALTEAKLKYVEWVKTAKENNVTELQKSMDINIRAGGYFLYGSKWQFQLSVNLKFELLILENKGATKYILLVKTGELKSSSNQYMDVDGFVLAFCSSKEIDNFINSISMDKITNFLSKPKTKDLFKN